MGAITRYHRDMRQLQKDVNHMQLTFDYSSSCREAIFSGINGMSDSQKQMLELLLSGKEPKEFLVEQAEIQQALDTTTEVLTLLNRYRKENQTFPNCKSCSRTVCQCPQRYKLNHSMYEELGGEGNYAERKYEQDPVSHRFIAVRPEEIIRRGTIQYLLKSLHVPRDMIQIEKYLSDYGIASGKRADLVIEAKGTDVPCPIAVIECKAPSIRIGEKELEQLYGYARDMKCYYCHITNGNETMSYFWDFSINGYASIPGLPDYKTMLTICLTQIKRQ